MIVRLRDGEQAAALGPGAEERPVTSMDRLIEDGHHRPRSEGSARPQTHLEGAERGNPDGVRAERPGKPTARKAEALSGNRMTQEANASRSKGQGKAGKSELLDRTCITRWI